MVTEQHVYFFFLFLTCCPVCFVCPSACLCLWANPTRLVPKRAKKGYHSPALWSPCDSASRTPALESCSRWHTSESTPQNTRLKAHHKTHVWKHTTKHTSETTPQNTHLKPHHKEHVWNSTTKHMSETTPQGTRVKEHHKAHVWNHTTKHTCETTPQSTRVKLHHKAHVWNHTTKHSQRCHATTIHCLHPHACQQPKHNSHRQTDRQTEW